MNNYKYKICTIAGGNSTLLVWNYPIDRRLKLSQQALESVEQIGFINSKNNSVLLTMMGNELSVNGTIATASFLSNDRFFTSGVKDEIYYTNANGATKVQFPLPYRTENSTVLFDGIGYKVQNTSPLLDTGYYQSRCQKYSLPAFGILTYQNNQIQPYVYVQKTRSLVKETACGSGSIAFSIITGIDRVKQPTNQIITIKLQQKLISVTAQVKTIKMNLSMQIMNLLLKV